MHFEEGLSARHKSKSIPKLGRSKSASEKLTEEELVKFSARVGIQMDVVRCFSDAEFPPWKHSLFGNPNDSETFRRRCEISETVVERNFDLAFQIIYEFNLPAVHIYAGVAASLAERKRGNQLTEFLRNIKGTIDEDDWDQVLGAAINVFANRHRERPDKLIDMLSSSHRIHRMEELGFWIEHATRASGEHGAVRWQLAKEFNEVVQLDFLSHHLAEQCMEELLFRSGPQEVSLEKGLFEEAQRFVGFLLSQDVKAFSALKKAPSPVTLKPFPVVALVTSFISGVIPKVEDLVVNLVFLQAPASQTDLFSSGPAILDGPSVRLERIKINVSFLVGDPFQITEILLWESVVIRSFGPRFFS
ncbi:hypothetical protein KI387_022758 [Taxus chinensis]|uniref:ZFYVE26-like TPR repeats domain-containing protein n=1 Tax=Taxus chinensis TaxID=29808 RepID=A0AA38G1J3_TAXCH|nr:hypothetical protein KI387_022758 [Taxus chinensis]